MPNCPICNSDNPKKLLDWSKYEIFKCKSCKLIFVTPLPEEEELTRFYQGFMFNKPEDYEINKELKKREKEIATLFGLSTKDSKLEEKKILDYGGGTGVVFQASRTLGLDAYYHDLDEQAISFTRQKFGLTNDKIISNLKDNKIRFDYILSDNVIEHVKRPIEFTDDLISELNDNGTLVIKTPNASNTETFFNPFISIKVYFARALKYNSISRSVSAYLNRFWHCEPPRHLYSFSAESFQSLIGKLSNKNIEFSISYYKIPRFANTVTEQFFSRDKRLTLIKSIAVRLIIWPVVIVEIVLQFLKWVLLGIGILSPGGIILTIKKRSN